MEQEGNDKKNEDPHYNSYVSVLTKVKNTLGGQQ